MAGDLFGRLGFGRRSFHESFGEVGLVTGVYVKGWNFIAVTGCFNSADVGVTV